MGLTFLFTGIAFAAVMAAMAVGVIFSNRRIKGSCGGLANMQDSQGKTICEGCTNPLPECLGKPLEGTTAEATAEVTPTKI